jgi:ABC-type lipoprotein release transport system permease subunit
VNLRRWLNDIAIGVRLAVGSGRTSAARLTLSAVGIAVAVAVLLITACAGTITASRHQREYAGLPNDSRADVAPTYWTTSDVEFREEHISVFYVRGSGPDSPKPAGLSTLPKAGEMYVSPALAEMLRSAGGELLRPRLPDRVVGTLPQELVPMPRDLVAWVGADETLVDWESTSLVYGFGLTTPQSDFDPGLMAMILAGGAVLLLPVFVFITSASRIAGAERDRRLSALRLVGAGARQVRWIAAAESLVSAVVGLVLGAALFLFVRQFAENASLYSVRVYESDLVPNPALVVLIVLMIPALAVMTALVALRRTIIEPLSVVRQSKPVRRRALWRFAVVAVGIVLLTTQLGAAENTTIWGWAVAGGVVLLLLGVPVLLPWVVERVVGHVKGGPSSWLLAIRRLQLDSGTSARVVGGVAVVLAGTIALQTMLLSLGGQIAGADDDRQNAGTMEVSMTSSLAPNVLKDLRQVNGIETAYLIDTVTAYQAETMHEMAILDCTTLSELTDVKTCEDGDTFFAKNGDTPPPPPGTTLEFRDYNHSAGEEWDAPSYTVFGTWTVPAATPKAVEVKDDYPLYSTILVTPGAVQNTILDTNQVKIVAQMANGTTPTQLEEIRNAIADYRWQIYVYTYDTVAERNVDQQAFVTFRNTLYAGSIFTLLLAGVSMLVMALEHIRERRRSLAVLTASGVPRGVLSRSLLWQVALPIVLGVLMALLTGLGLAALVMRLARQPLAIDWPGVAVLCAGAAALTILVSAMTLPFLRSATRLTTIRME